MADMTIKQKVGFHLQDVKTTEVVHEKVEYEPDDSVTLNIKGDYLLFDGNIQPVAGRLDNLTNATGLFSGNRYIEDWNIELPKLTNGNSMFQSCNKLKRWHIDLPSMVEAGTMFNGCSSLESFNSNLPEVTNVGYFLAGTPKLKNVCLNMPKATSIDYVLAGSMYAPFDRESIVINAPSVSMIGNLIHWQYLEYLELNMPKLAKVSGTSTSGLAGAETEIKRFKGYLPLLRLGSQMFRDTKLQSFDCALPSLEGGTGMFYNCKLDLASVQNIAATINDLAAKSKTGSIAIGMAAELSGNEEVATALAAIRAKGWTVTEQYNA